MMNSNAGAEKGAERPHLPTTKAGSADHASGGLKT
jgi:hypothetical protein